MSKLIHKRKISGGQLSKYDFNSEKKAKKGLKIFPYNKKCVKAASYDLTPTIIAMSSKVGLLETVYREKHHQKDRYYIYVRPKDTVLIVSNEYMIVPEDMAGYVSSRVSKVVEGFGHISTTIDPNWSGAALIAVSNPSTQRLRIYVGNPGRKAAQNQLATVTFHYLKTACSHLDVEQKQEGMRLDLLRKISYKEKVGIRAFLSKYCHPHRREFTEYFFNASTILGQEFAEKKMEKKWNHFLKDFSYLTLVPFEDNIRSKKAQRIARDFIVTENIFIRIFHWLTKTRLRIFIVLLIIFVVLDKVEILPEDLLKSFLELLNAIF